MSHALGGIADEANGQRQGEFPSASFVQQPCRHTSANGVQFQFGELPDQTEQETAVGRSWIVDPILISDEAAAIATHIRASGTNWSSCARGGSPPRRG